MKAILMAIALLVIGFVLLIKGADYFVDGSSAVAKKLKVPSLIIGFTIVAMGTSLPECAVSVAASVTNNNALAVSNAVGSNIFNLMVVCGICALIVPLTVQIETLKKEFPFSVFCALLLLVLGYWEMNLGRMEGIILIVIFACYLLWMIFSALKARREAGEEEIDTFPAWKCIVYIIGGAAAIKFGGDFVVDGATMVSVTGLGIQQLKDILWTELNKDSNKLEGVRTETIVHRAKDVAKLQEELKDMGEDEDFEYEYEEDADDDFDYEYEDENWDEEEEKK